MSKTPRSHHLDFFSSPPHVCGYFADREATTMFADPRASLDSDTYSWLSGHGFRRSGSHVYRPYCERCSACIAVRVAVDDFQPQRRHRRTLALNRDLTFVQHSARFELEHFALYQEYLTARHADSQMEASSPEAYMSFLTAPWSDTWFYEIRDDQQLLGVAVVDHLNDGLSAVYTFFSPAHEARSLGRYAILQQIELARAAGLSWLYLGYWIRDCRKMSYKDEYAPLEYFYAGQWHQRAPSGGAIPVSAAPG